MYNIIISSSIESVIYSDLKNLSRQLYTVQRPPAGHATISHLDFACIATRSVWLHTRGTTWWQWVNLFFRTNSLAEFVCVIITEGVRRYIRGTPSLFVLSFILDVDSRQQVGHLQLVEFWGLVLRCVWTIFFRAIVIYHVLLCLASTVHQLIEVNIVLYVRYELPLSVRKFSSDVQNH